MEDDMERNDQNDNLYIFSSCIMNKDIDDTVNELIDGNLDSYITKNIDERLKREIKGKSDLELSIECFKGINGINKIDSSYKDDMIEIMNNYNSDVKKKLLLK